MANESSNHLLGMLNDILDYSTIEMGELKLETQEFIIRDCVEPTVFIFEALASQKGLKLNYKIDTNVPKKILSDSLRLRQILTNLLSNSVKFTRHGSVSIYVSLKSEDESQIKIFFEITDTGIGIEKNKIASIFEVFNQVDNSHTREFGGTGLGLTISKNLVTMMGGEIWCESEIDKGTTFKFFICVPKQIDQKF